MGKGRYDEIAYGMSNNGGLQKNERNEKNTKHAERDHIPKRRLQERYLSYLYLG